MPQSVIHVAALRGVRSECRLSKVVTEIELRREVTRRISQSDGLPIDDSDQSTWLFIDEKWSYQGSPCRSVGLKWNISGSAKRWLHQAQIVSYSTDSSTC